MTGKWRTVTLLALAELLAMSVWFSASAVVPQLTSEWGLSGAQQSWLTMSVQVGFVTGALLSAILNLADRLPAQRLFATSAVMAAAANAAIPPAGRRTERLPGTPLPFMALALGPVFGIVSMLRLRRLPEAERMAGGRR